MTSKSLRNWYNKMVFKKWRSNVFQTLKVKVCLKLYSIRKYIRYIYKIYLWWPYLLTLIFLSFLFGGVGGKGSLNNSEMVKAVTLAFCSIQKRFIRDIYTKFGILNSTQFPNIGQNSDKNSVFIERNFLFYWTW